MLRETLDHLFYAAENTVELIQENRFRDFHKKFDLPVYFLQTMAFYYEFAARNNESEDLKLQDDFIKYTNSRFYNKIFCDVVNSTKNKFVQYIISNQYFIKLFSNLKLCYRPYLKHGFPFPSGPAAFIFSSIMDAIELTGANKDLGELEKTFKLYHQPEYRCPSVNMEIIRCNNMFQYSKLFSDKSYIKYAKEVFDKNIKDKLLDDGGITDSFKKEYLVSNAYTVLSYYHLIRINNFLNDKALEDFLDKGKSLILSLISPSGGSFFIGRSNGYIWPYSYLLNILLYYDEFSLIEDVINYLNDNFIEANYIKRNISKETINYQYGPVSTYVMLFLAKYTEFYRAYINRDYVNQIKKSFIHEDIKCFPISSIISANFKKFYIQISGLSEPYFFYINSCIIAYLESNNVPIIINGGKGKTYSFPVMSTTNTGNQIIEFRYANTINITNKNMVAVYEEDDYILEKRISIEQEQITESFSLKRKDNKEHNHYNKFYIVLTKEFYENYVKEKEYICSIIINGENLSQVNFNNIFHDYNHFCEIVYFEYKTFKKDISIVYSFRSHIPSARVERCN